MRSLPTHFSLVLGDLNVNKNNEDGSSSASGLSLDNFLFASSNVNSFSLALLLIQTRF